MSKGLFDKRIGLGNKFIILFLAIWFILFALYFISTGEVGKYGLQGYVIVIILIIVGLTAIFRGGVGKSKKRK